MISWQELSLRYSQLQQNIKLINWKTAFFTDQTGSWQQQACRWLEGLSGLEGSQPSHETHTWFLLAVEVLLRECWRDWPSSLPGPSLLRVSSLSSQSRTLCNHILFYINSIDTESNEYLVKFWNSCEATEIPNPTIWFIEASASSLLLKLWHILL